MVFPQSNPPSRVPPTPSGGASSVWSGLVSGRPGTSVAWGFLRWPPCGHEPLPGLFLPKCLQSPEAVLLYQHPPVGEDKPASPASPAQTPSFPQPPVPRATTLGPLWEAVTLFSKESNSPAVSRSLGEVSRGLQRAVETTFQCIYDAHRTLLVTVKMQSLWKGKKYHAPS